MKALTEILPDVFVIEVEADACMFEIWDNGLFYHIPQNIGIAKRLSKGQWQYLGYCTKDEISFDVEPYVERGGLRYLDYSVNPVMMTPDVYTKEESFRSLLLKHGLFWESETINIPKRDYKMFPGGKKAAQRFNEEYQQNEQSKLTGKLVVLKKVK